MKHITSRLLLAATTFVFSMAVAHAENDTKHPLLNKPFPAFKLKSLKNGKPVDSKSLKGKVVFVDFWASWCEPCKISMPYLNDLAKKYKGKVEFVGINVEENKADAETFLKDHPAPNIKFVSDEKQTMPKKATVGTMPSSFILDKSGKVKVAHKGFTEKDKAEIEADIKKVLAGK